MKSGSSTPTTWLLVSEYSSAESSSSQSESLSESPSVSASVSASESESLPLGSQHCHSGFALRS